MTINTLKRIIETIPEELHDLPFVIRQNFDFGDGEEYYVDSVFDYIYHDKDVGQMMIQIDGVIDEMFGDGEDEIVN